MKKLSNTAQLMLVLVFVAFLRLPSLFWPVISDDEAIYDAMARVIRAGGVMYRDALDHKPPGLAYFYALFPNIAWVHFSGILLAVITAWGLYLLAREFLRRELVWLPPVLYGIVTTTRCAYDGLAVNGEILMNAPTVWAVLAVVWAGKKRGFTRVILDFAAGFLMGIAGLAKWQALAAGLAFPFFAADSASFVRRILKRGPCWLLGVITPVAGAALYFKSHGVLEEFLQWGGLFNLRYISEGPDALWALERLGIQLASVVLPSIVFYAAAVYGAFLCAREKSHSALLVWSVLSLLCVAIGGRFFGHYFLQLELPLSLLAAGPLFAAFQWAPKRIACAMAIPALFFFALSLRPDATRALFDSGDPDWSQVGRAISLQTSSTDSIFVWGNVPELYHYSDRMMGTRFSFCNYLTGLSPGTRSEYDPTFQPRSVSEAWPLLLSDLENRRPALIIDTAAAGWKSYGKFEIARYPEFKAYLAAHYRRVDRGPAAVGAAVLYRRID